MQSWGKRLASQTAIIIVGAIVAVAMILVLYSMMTNASPGSPSSMPRGAPAADQKARRSDKVQLSSEQRRLYKHAMLLSQQSNFKGAAQLLESIGMYREAVSLLEKNNLPKDAAAILMRLRRPNRAAFIFEKAQMWREAMECYAMAQMDGDYARCAKESGDLLVAAEFFLKAGRYDEAAECYAEKSDHQSAARIFLKLGNKNRAIESYQSLVDNADNLANLNFQEDELELIIEYLKEGNTDSRLAGVLVAKNRLSTVIIHHVKNNNIKPAQEIYLRSATDMGPTLIGHDGFNETESQALAQLFLKVSSFDYAGMVYERLREYFNAGNAFRNAEDYERAAINYERADRKDLAVEMRITLAETGGPRKKRPSTASSSGKQSESPFTLIEEPEVPARASHPNLPPPPSIQTPKFTEPTPPLVQNDDDNPPLAISYEEDDLEPSERTVIVPTPDPIPPQVQETPSQNTFPTPPLQEGTKSGEENIFAVIATNQETSPTEEKTKPEEERAIEPIPEALKEAGINTAAAQQQQQENLFQSFTAPNTNTTSKYSHPPAFRAAKFFEDLDNEQIELIWELGYSKTYKKGDVVVDFNDEPKGVYFILTGEVSANRIVDGNEEEIDRMSAPSTIGEFWLLVDIPTQVKFISINQTLIHIIPREPFNSLLDKQGNIARKLYKRFTQRLIRKLLNNDNNKENKKAS